jgi:hypothetical protein
MDCRINKAKVKMKNKTKMAFSIVFLLCQLPTIAQTPGFDDDVQDVPINDYVLLLLTAGILLAYGLLQKRKTINKY